MKKFFSTQPIWYDGGLFIVRLILGIFMAYHGWEVFDKAKMEEYTTWEAFKNDASPVFMVYLGKGAELVGGILLILGWLTRVGALIIIFTMAYIAFFVGNGIVWYNDQHPFMFVLCALAFLFTGPGRYSLDAALERKK
jgi:putative oxidoreductase